MKTTKAQAMMICKLAIEINGTEGATKENDRPAVFVYMSPHIAQMTVHVYEHGWSLHNNPDIIWALYMDDCSWGDDPEECIEHLKRMKEEKK